MLLKATRRNILLAISVLKKGGIVAIPTETYYALCTNATQKRLIEKVIEIKGRSKDKGIPIVVKSYEQLSRFVEKPGLKTRLLIKKFWPGPLSLVFENKRLPRLLEGRKKSILARNPSGKILREVLKGLTFPLTATSANYSGKPNPKSAAYVSRQIGKKLGIIIDGGKTKARKPSTIVDLRSKTIKILRKGKIPQKKILSFLKQNL